MKHVLSCGILLCLFFSCLAQGKVITGKLNKAVPANTSSAKVKGIAASLDKLLLLNDVVAVSGKEAQQIKTSYNKVMKNPTYHELRYSWPTNRIKEVNAGFSKIKVPLDGAICIRGVEEMDLKKFNAYYRNLSAEEKNQATAQIDKTLKQDARVKDHTKEQKDLAKELAAAFMNDPNKYEEVPGLGTKALWKGNELFVLKGNLKFVVFCDVSEQAQENLTSSKLIAQKILSRL